jgi:hypothetical protein
MRLRPRVIFELAREPSLPYFRLLRHWRPLSLANRESGQAIVAECSACQALDHCKTAVLNNLGSPPSRSGKSHRVGAIPRAVRSDSMNDTTSGTAP